MMKETQGWKRLFSKKPKDERVTGEINRIYRVGFHILSFGILLDIYLQLTSGYAVRPVEFGVFLLAQMVCVVLMVRKGMMDDDRYAEMDVFPKRHYLLLGSGAGVGAGLLFIILRAVFELPRWEFGARSFWIIQGVLFASVAVLTAVSIYALQYLVFRIAKRKRDRARDADDMKL